MHQRNTCAFTVMSAPTFFLLRNICTICQHCSIDRQTPNASQMSCWILHRIQKDSATQEDHRELKEKEKSSKWANAWSPTLCKLRLDIRTQAHQSLLVKSGSHSNKKQLTPRPRIFHWRQRANPFFNLCRTTFPRRQRCTLNRGSWR